jgi:nucleotide-binding universal stress UspA family protein
LKNRLHGALVSGGAAAGRSGKPSNMKKILVPTDFSTVANAATHYAADFARAVSAEVTLLHVLNIGGEGKQLKNWAKLEGQATAVANVKATSIINAAGNGITMNYEIVSGYPPEDAIDKFAKKVKAGLIVMGTAGASGLKKVVVGSHAAAVASRVGTPVLTLPPKARFSRIKHVLYATDMLHLNSEVKKIADFARLFDAFVTIVYINEQADLRRNRHGLVKILSRMAHYPKLAFTVVRAKDIVSGLHERITTLRPDVLAMFTHRPGFLEKAMGKSVTREMISEAKLPVLSFNRTKSK